MSTCFERIVNNDPQSRFAGDWTSIYHVTILKEYDLNYWYNDYDDIMRRLGADMDGDIIRINDEPYYINCVTKQICEASKAPKMEG